MSTSPYSIPVFGGLNLVDDPEEVGAKEAIDILNIDLDKPGLSHIRSRDGYTNFTAAASSWELDAVAPFYKIAGAKQLLISLRSDGTDARYAAIDTAGVLVSAVALVGFDIVDADFCRFGGPAAEVVYAASWKSTARTTVNNVYKWDGATWGAVPIVITPVRVRGSVVSWSVSMLKVGAPVPQISDQRVVAFPP